MADTNLIPPSQYLYPVPPPPDDKDVSDRERLRSTFDDPEIRAQQKAAHAHDVAAEKTGELAQEREKTGAEYLAKRGSALEAVNKHLDTPRPNINDPQFKQQELPSPPKPEDYKRFSYEFLGAMVGFAALAGAIGRGKGTASVSAFSSALEGWREGNATAYQNGITQWKETTEEMLANNQTRLQKYNAIVADRNQTTEEMMKKFELAGSLEKDQLIWKAAVAGDYNMVGQILDSSAKAHERVRKVYDEITAVLTNQDTGLSERMTQLKRDMATPEGQEAFNSLPGYVRLQLKGMMDQYGEDVAEAPPFVSDADVPTDETGRPPAPGATTPPKAPIKLPGELRGPAPPTMKGKERAERAFRQRKWAEKGSEPDDLDWAQFNRQQHQPRSAAGMSLQEYIEETIAETGKPPSSHELIQFQAEAAGETARGRTAGSMAARSDAATEEVAVALPLALESSRKLPRGRLVPLNQLLQMWEKGTSDLRYNDFIIKNISLLNAYVRAMNPQGIPRVAERAETHAIGLLSTATSTAAYETQVRALWQEVVNQRHAIKQTRTGKPGSDEFPEPAPPDAGAGSVIKYDEHGNRIK